MNKILLLLLCCAISTSVFADDEYYVWTDGQTATNALTFINTHGWFPVVGVNKKTGKKEKHKARAMCWTDKVLIRNDGKFCFRRVPNNLLDALKVSIEQRLQFFQAFHPDVEVSGNDWFPEQE